MLKVVIDPGHYNGYNRGVDPEYSEGTKMYILAGMLKNVLEEEKQIEAIITRPDPNKDMPVFNRGHLAVEKNADLFLSLHSNAIADKSKYDKAYGVSVYRSLYLPDSADLGNKLADAIVEVMSPITGVTYSRGVFTRKSENSSMDYYGVIRGAVNKASAMFYSKRIPVQNVFIIEHGFHTNPKECAFLKDNVNLAAIARAEGKVIKEHFGIIPLKEPEEGNLITEMDTDVIGVVKVIYEGMDGVNIHMSPEWGNKNLSPYGPVGKGTILRACGKMKVGSSYMYKLYEGGYITADERYVTFENYKDQALTISTPAMTIENKTIKVGSKVKVIRNNKYGGGTFKAYYDSYDVISMNGSRVVIGRGKVITAAVDIKDIEAI